MEPKALIKKMISHRVTGFGYGEQSRKAFESACQSDIPYLEVDLRITLDRILILYHDPYIKLNNGNKIWIHKTSAQDIFQYIKEINSTEPIITFCDALTMFASSKNKDQKLILDIKDYGHEQEITKLIDDHQLNERVIFISWVPQTLFALASLNVKAPLFLSCVITDSWGIKGHLVNFILRLSPLKWKYNIILGKRHYNTEIANTVEGKAFKYVTDSLPQEMKDLLKKHNGGICLNHNLITEKIKQTNQKQGLNLWVYTTHNLAQYVKLAQSPEIDLVFSDEAPTVFSQIQYIK